MDGTTISGVLAVAIVNASLLLPTTGSAASIVWAMLCNPTRSHTSMLLVYRYEMSLVEAQLFCQCSL